MPSSSKRKSKEVFDQGSDFEVSAAEESDTSSLGARSADESDSEVEEPEEEINTEKKRKRKSSISSPRKSKDKSASSLQQMKPKKAAKNVVISYISLPFLSQQTPKASVPALPPVRSHTSNYHRPGLIDKPAQDALFSWFSGVESKRDMPWRKDFINPHEPSSISNPNQLRSQLSQRAYEVWLSEIMLQQTRVSTVCEYFKKWLIQFPTIQDLSNAHTDDVLACWKGLGYYSRATRILEAAKKVTNDREMDGLLPETPELLERDVPGVGKYTAGAISSIVFGHAVPLIDGNVIRVLSRQMALFSNSQSKSTTDLLWSVADSLVKSAAKSKLSEEGEQEIVGEDGRVKRSPYPGKWNQALMELGSTVCTPTKPLCQSCPIQSSCGAYGEGKLLATKAGLIREADDDTTSKTDEIIDIEDLCTFCEPFELASEDMEGGDEAASGKKQKGKASSGANQSTSISKNSADPKGKPNGGKPKGQQSLLSSFSFTRTPKSTETSTQADPDLTPASSNESRPNKPKIKNEKALEMIEAHVKRFPLKVPKKKAREEECVVCVIEKVSERDHLESTDAEGEKRLKGEDGSSHPVKSKAESLSSTFLLEQRPETGLLASLWEHPTLTLSSENNSTPKSRKEASIQFVKTLVSRSNFQNSGEKKQSKSENNLPKFKVVHQGEVGNVPHVFSHIKLNMHVHRFKIIEDTEGSSRVEEREDGNDQSKNERNWKWVSSTDVDKESCGTGMRKAWELSKKAAKGELIGKGEKKGKGKGRA